MRKAVLFVALLALGGTVLAGSEKKAGQTMTDQEFMKEATIGGMLEVRLGELAQQNGGSQAVKDFGKTMVTDHWQADQELKDLAAKKNVTLPTALDKKHQQVVDRLSALKGAAFDQAYIKDMVADHEGDIKEFEREAMKGKDSDVKQWAADKLDTLRNHLQMAVETRQKIGGGKAE
jgi:putative membrane protein